MQTRETFPSVVDQVEPLDKKENLELRRRDFRSGLIVQMAHSSFNMNSLGKRGVVHHDEVTNQNES